jgi:imidazolonepropionase-like amidohydrolase
MPDRSPLKLFILLLLTSLLTGAGASGQVSDTINTQLERYILSLSERKVKEHVCYTVIKNVKVVDVEKATTRTRTVIVADGEIVSSRRILFRSVKNARVINGRGLYMAPALTDMHVHYRCSNRDRLLYLLYGVTAVRNMHGSSFHLDEKELLSRKLLIGPRVYTSGPALTSSGNRGVPGFVNDTSAARNEVRSQYIKGYDFIKIENGLDSACVFAVLDEAGKLGMHVAAELPGKIRIKDVLIYSDLLTIENAQGFSTNDAGTIDAAARSRIAICPNLVATGNAVNIPFVDLNRTAGAALMTAKQKAQWHELYILQFKAKVQEQYREKLTITRRLHSRGATLLPGTEAGLNLPFIIAGSSLHQELAELQKAGLSPQEVIQAATVNAAAAMGMKYISGTIQKGMVTDFVLLSDDPLLNVENYQAIKGVMINGTWLSAEDLEEIKLQVLKNEL